MVSCEAVMGRTISTRAMAGAGLKKWMPHTWSGRRVAMASSITGRVEVLVAMMACSGTIWSSSLNRSRLTLRSSTTDSTTRSQSARSARSAVAVTSPRALVRSSSVIFSRSTCLAERRRRLLVEARGRVLDVGAGTGANLPHYRDVDAVVALEPNASMARRLAGRLSDAVVPVSVVESDLDDPSLEEGSFDTAVCTLVLCTVPDADVALRRIHSLLRPDGRLLFLEHVRVTGLWGRLQHLVTPVWKSMALGCHLDRDPLHAMR